MISSVSQRFYGTPNSRVFYAIYCVVMARRRVVLSVVAICVLLGGIVPYFLSPPLYYAHAVVEVQSDPKAIRFTCFGGPQPEPFSMSKKVTRLIKSMSRPGGWLDRWFTNRPLSNGPQNPPASTTAQPGAPSR